MTEFEKKQGRQAPEIEQTVTNGTTFVLVRHGQTIWNSQGRWQGWLDSPLTELGRQQARQAAEVLREIEFHVAYSSDSGRAMETAEIILSEVGEIALNPAPELRERSYGAYEGLNTPEIDAQYPGSRFNPERESRETWRAPGDDGESLVEVRARIAPFLQELSRRHPGQTVLVVTHSNVVRIIDSLATGQPLDDIWHRVPPNACVFIVRGTADGELTVVQHFCEP